MAKGKYHSIYEIKQANEKLGEHFFSESSMKFFNSRVSYSVYGGRYFVTSEKDDYNTKSKRLYTVRRAEDDGSITNASAFQQYSSYSGAIAAAKRWGESEE